MPRFAANLAYLFTEYPFIERFGAAAKAGFEAVELQFPYDTPAAEVKRELDRRRLTMIGVNTPIDEGEFGSAAVPGRAADFAAHFRRALDYVGAIGGRAVHCLAGKVQPDDRVRAEAAFVANLLRASDAAAQAGITVLIEPINPRDRSGYFLNSAEHAADLLTKIDRVNVRMQFDFYHAQIVGGDLIRRFEKYLPLVGHVQIAAVPSRAEPDEGEVNYPAIFGMLDDIGYAGWIGAEYRPRVNTEAGLGWGLPYGLRPTREGRGSECA